MSNEPKSKLPLPAPVADAKAPVAAAPVAAPIAPAAAMVAVALSRSPIAVNEGTVATCHGCTFRAPVSGMLRTSDKAGAGWPAVPVGTDFYVVAATYNPGNGAPAQAAAVVVTAIPAVAGTTGNGGRSGEWKAWPFTGGRLRMRDRAGKPVLGAD